ncbi:anoctamin-5 isoform X3 [Ciona intestinalis]
MFSKKPLVTSEDDDVTDHSTNEPLPGQSREAFSDDKESEDEIHDKPKKSKNNFWKRKKAEVAALEAKNTQEAPSTPDAEPAPYIGSTELAYKALTRPEYTKPAPRTLPPINTKTAAFAGTASALLGPLVPEMDQTNHPKTDGQTNPSYNGSDFVAGATLLGTTTDTTAPVNGGKDGEFYKRPKATLYFHDGVRFIDYVIAYQDHDEHEHDKDDEQRQHYEENLEKAGLILEREPKEQSQDQNTYFVKVHVPWPILLKYAERMKMKMPLKEERREEFMKDSSEICGCVKTLYRKLVAPCVLNTEEVTEMQEPDYYTTEFVRDKMEFFDIQDEKSFFANSQRSRIAHRIMSETKYGPKRVNIGINNLISSGVYECAFPLHEGKHKSTESKLAINANMRRLLYWEWARWGRWYKFQPLDLIRSYLGDKIALYFAFMGFYTKLLWPAAMVGIGVLTYGIVTLFTWSNVSQEICDETYPTYAGNLTMCPLCDEDCSYWKLKTSCLAARITYVFDNEATMFFAIFMSLWATMFLEFWKRRQFELSYEWDLVDYDEERDLVRPEFEAQVTKERLNPVTGDMEPYLAAKDKYTRTCLSLVTVFFWILVVIAAVFAVIVYRLAISAIFAVSVDLSSLGAIGTFATPAMLTTITASMLSLIIIMCLNKVYEKVAIWLTNMELPRTQTEFEDRFTFKMFCFQFVNFYSYLFYVAFFKGTISGTPGHYTYLFGSWRWEQCDAGGCMYELSIQLIIIMFGKQLWNNFIELVMPWLQHKYRQWKSQKVSTEMKDNEYTRWEQDYDLNQFTEMGLFYEYLEMVIQFGFVTLFVAAFPLAPVLALVNNIIEIRLDANKFICELRRPLAHKCSDIGAWYYLLEFIGNLAVVTNAFTIAITSEAIPKLVYYYVYSLDMYPSSTYNGYVNNSMSYFNTSDFEARSMPNNPDPFGEGNITTCRYPGYLSPPTASPKYEYTTQYWHNIAGKLAFVIVVEHVVFFLKRLLDYLIPDRPRKLRDKIKREHFLVQHMLFKAETQQLLKQLSQGID